MESGDYVAEGNTDLPSISDFEERYQGAWENFREYAENLADDIGLLADVPEEIARYFDWQAWSRDLAMDYSTYDDPEGGVFVFTLETAERIGSFGFRLTDTGRFEHDPGHVARLLAEGAWQATVDTCVLRREGNLDVRGLVVAAVAM